MLHLPGAVWRLSVLALPLRPQIALAVHAGATPSGSESVPPRVRVFCSCPPPSPKRPAAIATLRIQFSARPAHLHVPPAVSSDASSGLPPLAIELQALASSQAYLATNDWPNIEEAMRPVCRDGIAPFPKSPTQSEIDGWLFSEDTVINYSEDTAIEIHTQVPKIGCARCVRTGVGFARLSLAATTSSSVAASRFNYKLNS